MEWRLFFCRHEKDQKQFHHPEFRGYSGCLRGPGLGSEEQNAFGDWAAISIGGQYYLFADYDPATAHGNKNVMNVAWFTSLSIDEQFTFCGNIGQGHLDPDIMFAEGKFDWKLALCSGSGGWTDPKPGEEPEGSPEVQLFNLADDPGETTNLQGKHPERVEALTELLRSYVDNGRSTPGAKQSNVLEVDIGPNPKVPRTVYRAIPVKTN